MFGYPQCVLEMNRDLNVAINLKSHELAHLTVSTGSSLESYACGDLSGGETTAGWSTSHGLLKQVVGAPVSHVKQVTLRRQNGSC